MARLTIFCYLVCLCDPRPVRAADPLAAPLLPAVRAAQASEHTTLASLSQAGPAAASSATTEPSAQATIAPVQGKARLMILGIAHLVARRDVHNSQFTDGPLTPKRQAQIADIVRRLAQFRPTKVMIEVPADNATFAKRYAQYLNGAYALPADEIYQFGFRLAKLAGNGSIYPVDTWGPSIVDDSSPAGKRIDAYLQENLGSTADPVADAFLKRSSDLERTGTYLDLLRYLNTDEAIRANASWYSVVAGMGRNTDEAGATYVAQWYTRNTFIFSNILSLLEPSDRAVVLMGQGHEYLLREFTRLNPNLVDVDPLTYLGGR